MADLYLVIYSAAIAPESTTPHGREGFYIAENGTHAWYDISKTIAQVLYDKGLGGSPEPTAFSADELAEHFGSEVSTSGAGCRFAQLMNLNLITEYRQLLGRQ